MRYTSFKKLKNKELRLLYSMFGNSNILITIIQIDVMELVDW